MTAPVVVQPDALDALATELAGLAAQLVTEVENCRSAAGALAAALEGSVGEQAAEAARAWSALLDSLARQAGTCSAALLSVAAEYRVVDAALAQGLGGDLPGQGAGPR